MVATDDVGLSSGGGRHGSFACNSFACRCDSEGRHGVFRHGATPLEAQSRCQATNCAVQRVYWHKGIIQAYTARTATWAAYKTPHAAGQAIGVVKKGLEPNTILNKTRAYERIV